MLHLFASTEVICIEKLMVKIFFADIFQKI